MRSPWRTSALHFSEATQDLWCIAKIETSSRPDRCFLAWFRHDEGKMLLASGTSETWRIGDVVQGLPWATKT